MPDRTTLPGRSPGSVVLALLVSAFAACGGGGDHEPKPPDPAVVLPDQSGCFWTYTGLPATTTTGNDPLLPLQWHLNNTGQLFGTPGEDVRALNAWNATRGSGTRIAVVDDAIETIHADLSQNAVAGASYSYRPATAGNVYPLPCSSADTHGTSVAGVATARDGNAIGGAGVAPRAGLVGYSALSTNTDADVADALVRGLADNGVYNNSWGSQDDGVLNRAPDSFYASLETGIATGRGGKGAVYVFPGGNGACFNVETATGKCQSETTGLDGYLNHRGVIAVCAVDQYGKASNYSEPGASLLVCAPSSSDTSAAAITTTAVKNAYRNDFGGTSASTPIVSGVVALMLSANPALTWRDVRWILAKTARRNDAGEAGWTNAYGLWFNPRYGFGVVNAQDAVAAAKSWSSVGGNSTQKSCGPYTSTPDVALPDARGALVTPQQDTITVADCAISQIEYVEVAFDATHEYSGDLRVILTSPHGLVSTLANARACPQGVGVDACGGYADWRFGSARHLGEPAAGAWRLQVTDIVTRNTGTWHSWGLRIWGR